MDTSGFYIEIRCQQKNHTNERICGDVFLSDRVKEENRFIVVLSDGMGHGVKANVLATLTATMALNFTKEHKEFNRIADIIMNTLPVCSERKMSYSTFSILDIELNEMVKILEYDYPQFVVFRGSKLFEPICSNVLLTSEHNKGKELIYSEFFPMKEDRIFLFSDGVMQSGMGSEEYPFGWGRDKVIQYIEELIEHQPFISASKLATKIVNAANSHDNYSSKDDTSCAVIYFREPRKLLLSTGPPFEERDDHKLALMIDEFKGKKIICGATTIDLVARELKREVVDHFEFNDPDLPPISEMNGVDLVTEGILTLSKVNELLKLYNNNTLLGKGPADLIVKLLIESDEIDFIVGTKINIAHQDPNVPVELEIRRTVVKRIARLLEEKFLKEVKIEFL